MSAEELTRSIRHDLFSPLQTIQNTTYLMKIGAVNMEEGLEMINNALETITEILNNPPGTIKAEKILFDTFIRKTLKSIIVPENINLVVDIKHQQFYFDSVKMERVLVNLIKNAIEVMGSDCGTLTIETEQEGSCDIIRVKDTGPGIPESIMKTIFIAQHTTKDSGHGQGLISCRQIVTNHKGIIIAENKPGETVFTISLPKEPQVPS